MLLSISNSILINLFIFYSYSLRKLVDTILESVSKCMLEDWVSLAAIFFCGRIIAKILDTKDMFYYFYRVAIGLSRHSNLSDFVMRPRTVDKGTGFNPCNVNINSSSDGEIKTPLEWRIAASIIDDHHPIIFRCFSGN